MKKEEFIQQYVIAYMALKRASINRQEIIRQDLLTNNVELAMMEGEDIWNTMNPPKTITNDIEP